MQRKSGALARAQSRAWPGPLFLVTLAAWLFLTSAVVRAHDPGLSALDVSVTNGVVSAQLVAAADVALIVSGTNADARIALGRLAGDSVRVAIDGIPLPAVVDDVSIEGGAARVKVSFAMPESRGNRPR